MPHATHPILSDVLDDIEDTFSRPARPARVTCIECGSVDSHTRGCPGTPDDDDIDPVDMSPAQLYEFLSEMPRYDLVRFGLESTECLDIEQRETRHLRRLLRVEHGIRTDTGNPLPCLHPACHLWGKTPCKGTCACRDEAEKRHRSQVEDALKVTE